MLWCLIFLEQTALLVTHVFLLVLNLPTYRRLIQAIASKVDDLLGDGRDDKDFAVAHPAGAGDFDDLAQDFFDATVVDPQRDFDLGQESQRVFAVGVLIEVALLPAVAFDLADAASLERRPLEPVQHSLGQKGFDDGDDLFHGFTAIAKLRPRAKPAALAGPRGRNGRE